MRAERVCKRSNVGLKTDVSARVQEYKSNDEGGMLGELISFGDVLPRWGYPLVMDELAHCLMCRDISPLL